MSAHADWLRPQLSVHPSVPQLPLHTETAAILSSLTSTCRRHAINPQAYLTELLANLPDTPISRLDDWLPDRWKRSSTPPSPAQT